MSKSLELLRIAGLGAACAITLATAATAAPNRPLRELRCDFVENDNGRLQAIEAPGLRVLAQTAEAGAFQPQVPQGMAGMMCARSSVVPAAYDDEVIALGLPLFIAETGSSGRLGVLEFAEGRYRFRVLHGELTADEQPAIDSRLAEFQGRLPPPTATPQR